MNLPVVENKNTDILLKKHVNAIHCTNNITLIQRKIANVLLYNAYPDLMQKNTFTIVTKDLCHSIGYYSRNFKLIQKSLEALCTTGLTWGVLNDNDNLNNVPWTVSSFLSAATLGNGICTYEYSNALKKVLYRPEIYGEINLTIQASFTSSIGLALYETCARFSKINQTGWLSIAEVRDILGVSFKKYIRYRDFKQKVVMAAVNEVNEKTNFNITLRERLEGRLASHLNFIISSKDKIVSANVTADENIVCDNSMDVLINEFGVGQKIALNLVEKYGNNYINEKILIIKSSESYKLGKITNLAGAMVSAISKNYNVPINSKSVIDHEQRSKAILNQKKFKKQKEQEDLKEKYRDYINGQVVRYLDLLSEYDRIDLNNDFIRDCTNTKNILALKKAQNSDFESPSVKYVFNKFVVDNYLKGRIMSKEQFFKNGC
jgi:hypothetical protein